MGSGRLSSYLIVLVIYLLTKAIHSFTYSLTHSPTFLTHMAYQLAIQLTNYCMTHKITDLFHHWSMLVYPENMRAFSHQLHKLQCRHHIFPLTSFVCLLYIYCIGVYFKVMCIWLSDCTAWKVLLSMFFARSIQCNIFYKAENEQECALDNGKLY